ncbi:fatty acyl-AMP ligase [Nonomuraea sp. NPDC003709]|uniref:fatty acyl-AMP ligase n=1 Tax=Nonomuraea sp. NPDC003709 TaxID=3154450 RepID=UPI0033B27C36
MTMELLSEAVRRRAGIHGSAPAVTSLRYVVRQGGRHAESTTLTYGELDERAAAVAAELAHVCSPRARVALLCPHDPSYVIAFLGCQYAGVVAVPLPAPDASRGRERLESVLADCRPEAVLTSSDAAPAVRRALERCTGTTPTLIETDSCRPSTAWRPPDIDPDGLAYLQYTSGSTRSPAGVRITRRGLAAGSAQLRAHFPGAATLASWVPFSHDMGLVFGIAHPLSVGAHTIHLSPMAFIQDPLRWLEAITRYRADWSVTPPFGLTQCVRAARRADRSRTLDLRSLDLRSLRSLNIAGEAVHAEDVEAFTAAFAGAGLAPEVLAPSYGLAEATLAVTAPPLGEGMTATRFERAALAAGEVVVADDTRPAQRLVGCGRPKTGMSIRIADPGGDELPPGRVGEILLRGPNVADGYWRAAERTAAAFGAGDGWLRTGDLGFQHDNHLYIVGRASEVIIIRGRNHHPSDIEATIEQAHERTVAAAFSVDLDGAERLVILVECDHVRQGAGHADRQDFVQELRRSVTSRHGVTVHRLLLVRPGSLPRTSSGKIQRGRCRERYLASAYA